MGPLQCCISPLKYTVYWVYWTIPNHPMGNHRNVMKCLVATLAGPVPQRSQRVPSLFLSVFHPFQGHALLEALEASRSEQLPSTPVVSWPRLSEPPGPGYCNKMEENGGIMLINGHSPSELRVVSQQKCQTTSGSSMFKPFINGWVWNRAGNHSFCPQNIGVSKRMRPRMHWIIYWWSRNWGHHCATNQCSST